jgi:predicted ester cyclase
MDDQIAEGHRVVHRLTCRGAHPGDFMGAPPSGACVAVSGININRTAGGRIAEDC